MGRPPRFERSMNRELLLWRLAALAGIALVFAAGPLLLAWLRKS